MRRSGNKILIIALIIIAVLAISGGVFAYLYLATDIFRTGQELFEKYLTQNVKEITQIVNIEEIKNLEDEKKQKANEESLAISYTESGDTEPEGKISIETQNDPLNNKYYGIIALEGQDAETLKLEYMQENDMYSLRFTNAVKQFLTIQNSNLKQLLTKFGLEEDEVENIPDTINFDENIQKIEDLKLTDAEKKAELEKYVQILYNNIPKEKYTKTRKSVITVNAKTVSTNAYSLKLNSEDIKNLLIQLLEALKQDEIILAKLEKVENLIKDYSQEESLKDSFVELIQDVIDDAKELNNEEINPITITIYEEKGKTIRIKLEEALGYLIIDTTEENGKKQVNINYTRIDEENTQSSNIITIEKQDDNNIKIKTSNIIGETKEEYEINIAIIKSANNTQINITIDDKDGKMLIERNVAILNEIEYKVTLDSKTNIILNDLSQENIENIFILVEQKLEEEYIKEFKPSHFAPLNVIVEPILTSEIKKIGANAMENANLSEKEKEVLNAKFAKYEGENISTTDINTLLKMVYIHNTQEADNLSERYIIVSGDIELASDATKVTKIEGEKTYKVQCKIGQNGLVEEIIIRDSESTGADTENADTAGNIANMDENIINALN